MDAQKEQDGSEALVRNNRLLRQFVEHTPAAIAMFDRDMKYIMASRRFRADYNLRTQDIIGRSHYEIFPEIPQRWKEIHRRCLAGATERAEADPFPRQDGGVDWVRWEIQPWHQDNGEIGGIILFSEVITEQKRAEEKISISERRLRDLINGLGPYMFVGLLSADGKVLEVNQPALNAADLKREDVLGQLLVDTAWFSYSEEVRQRMHQAIERAAQGQSSRFDVDILAAENQFITIDFCLQPLPNELGEIKFLVPSAIVITERKQAEEALRESENRLRATFDQAAVGIAHVAPDGRFLKVNSKMSDIVGYSSEELLKINFQNITHPDDLAADLESVRQLLAGDIPHYSMEKRYFRKGGDIVWVNLTVALVHKQSGEPDYFLSVIEDITERKAAEQALDESEARYRNIIEVAPVGIAVHQGGKVVFTNPAGLRLLGAESDDQVIGKPLTAIIHPDGLEQARVRIQKMLAGEKGLYPVEDRYLKLDGTPIEVEVIASPLTYQGETAVQVIVTDITDRKRAEEEIRKSIRIWDNTFNAISDMICVINRNHEFLNMNKAGCEALGLPKEQVVGRKCYELVHGTSAPINFCPCAASLKTGQASVREYEEKGRFYELGAWPVAGALGGIESVTHVVRDITVRKQQEKGYKQLIDGMNDAAFVIDFKGKFMEVNESAVRYLGYSRAELLAMGPADIDTQMSPDEIGALIELMKTDQRQVFETRHGARDGRTIPVEISSSPVMYQGQEAILCVARDITERKLAEQEKEKLQAQFIQAQKMESVGRLAGGVAHDFNNMLSVILGYSDLLMETIDTSDPMHADVEEIRLAAKRSADITRQLLAFARQQAISPEVVDLNRTVESMLKMLRRLIGEDIDLIWQPAVALWAVNMDPSQIDQILANLIVNARDAIGGIGKITIETQNISLDESYCVGHPGFVPGEFVILAVNDDGCGMDKKTLDNVFEPFFTTKELGKGTGLGLATVYGIVKQNKGFINVYSEPGMGTTIRIFLPRHRSVVEGVKAPIKEPVPKGRGETILLVEDEPSILMLTQTLLERLGYTVLSAATPGTALELAETHQGKIHLLVTDVVMPEMNGRELADRLQARYPKLKIMFMSGYTADVIAHRGVLDKEVPFIQKPFSYKDMAVKVREALEK